MDGLEIIGRNLARLGDVSDNISERRLPYLYDLSVIIEREFARSVRAGDGQDVESVGRLSILNEIFRGHTAPLGLSVAETVELARILYADLSRFVAEEYFPSVEKKSASVFSPNTPRGAEAAARLADALPILLPVDDCLGYEDACREAHIRSCYALVPSGLLPYLERYELFCAAETEGFSLLCKEPILPKNIELRMRVSVERLNLSGLDAIYKFECELIELHYVGSNAALCLSGKRDDLLAALFYFILNSEVVSLGGIYPYIA